MNSESDSPTETLGDRLWGTVVAVQANFYQVRLSRQEGQMPFSPTFPPTLLCTRRSRLKKIGQKVMVGDRVAVEPDWNGERGAISEVRPRRSQIDRPPIANVDSILLMFALADPPLEPLQLSRFLVKAELTGLTVGLCLNKTDLVSPEQCQDWRDRLQTWGYDPIFISLQDNEDAVKLRDFFDDRITVVAGPSGVGKSSLIRHFIPDANPRVGKVSGKLGRGRHTTRHVELFQLPMGGLLADTPGFNQPELDCTPAELMRAFPEIRQRLEAESCEFSDCLHGEEPNCAVRGDWERYEYYLLFLEEAIALAERNRDRAETEETLKVKDTRSGEQQYEPKLETKKYRRVSRRRRHQDLQDLYREIEEGEID